MMHAQHSQSLAPSAFQQQQHQQQHFSQQGTKSMQTGAVATGAHEQPATTTPAANAPKDVTADAKEIGWCFLMEYYRYMAQEPNLLHRFYTKDSFHIHGSENDGVTDSIHGQKQIHDRVTAIDPEGCKVELYQVDSQPSADDGVVVQVIGGLCKRNDSYYKKYTQTFFLAQQPGGYYVRNDIFRYLGEWDEGDDDEHSEEPVPASAPATSPASVPVPAPTENDSADSAVARPEEAIGDSEPIAAESSEPTLETMTHAPDPELKLPEHSVDETNALAQLHLNEDVSSKDAAIAHAGASQQNTTKAGNEQQQLPAASTEVPSTSLSKPAAAAQPPTVSTAPRTWANLASRNTGSWASAIARPAAEKVSTNTQPVTLPFTRPTVASTDRAQTSPQVQAIMSSTTVNCFIKGVTSKLSSKTLHDYLANNFGSLRDFDCAYSKACAFVEFHDVQSAQKAMIASLPKEMGGQGPIMIDDHHIIIDARKERKADRMHAQGYNSGGRSGASQDRHRSSNTGPHRGSARGTARSTESK